MFWLYPIIIYILHSLMPICNVFTIRKGNKKGRKKTHRNMLDDWHKKTWLGENDFCPCVNKQLGKWVGIVAPGVGSAPVSAVAWERAPAVFGESLGVSCSVRGWWVVPQGKGRMRSSHASWEWAEPCLSWILICNYGTSYLTTTNSPCPNLLANTPSWKGGKPWKDTDSSSILPVLKNTRITYFNLGAWQEEEEERKESPEGGPR